MLVRRFEQSTPGRVSIVFHFAGCLAGSVKKKEREFVLETWKRVGMLPSKGSLCDILESSWMVTLGLGHMSTQEQHSE